MRGPGLESTRGLVWMFQSEVSVVYSKGDLGETGTQVWNSGEVQTGGIHLGVLVGVVLKQ